MQILDEPKPVSLPLHWLRYCTTQEERDTIYKSLLGSRYILGILQRIVKDEKQALYRAEESIEDFKDPDWALKQAFRNGERKGLRIVEDLLNFIK
jgi:hypothetical protein